MDERIRRLERNQPRQKLTWEQVRPAQERERVRIRAVLWAKLKGLEPAPLDDQARADEALLLRWHEDDGPEIAEAVQQRIDELYRKHGINRPGRGSSANGPM